MIDARSGSLFADAKKDLEALDKAGTPAHVLFFDASDDVLLRRYSETRHRHPVDAPGGVSRRSTRSAACWLMSARAPTR